MEKTPKSIGEQLNTVPDYLEGDLYIKYLDDLPTLRDEEIVGAIHRRQIEKYLAQEFKRKFYFDGADLVDPYDESTLIPNAASCIYTKRQLVEFIRGKFKLKV